MGLDRTAGCGEDVAPYALGALPEGEARDFERHLRSCELCQTDLETLRPAVDALPYATESVAPPPELRRRIMGVVEADAKARRASERDRRERRFSFRPLPALAAACAVLVVGVVLGTSLTGGEDVRRIDGQVTAAGASAALEVEDGGEARLVVDDMPAPPMGRVYQVWVRRGDEAPRPTDALFEVRGGHAEVAVPGDVGDVDEILVTHEPRGGSESPTRAPSVVVAL
jgi:anti-sigma-K factor RskA